MKKIFTIISASIMACVLIFLSIICFVKKNVPMNYNEPAYIYVFKKETVAIKSGGFTRADKEYKKIMNSLKASTNLSIFDRLRYIGNLKPVVNLDDNKRYSMWSSEIKKEQFVIELIYTTEQDIVVTTKGKTRVISYFSIIFTFAPYKGFKNLIVYYSTTNTSDTTTRDENYAQYTPIVLQGYTDELIDIIENYK